MRTLFLAAKNFAIDAQSEKIMVEHLKKAFESLEFVDKNAQSKLEKLLGMEYTLNHPISEEMISKASKVKEIKMHEDLSVIKRQMEKEGYGLSRTVSKVFVEKVNALAQVKSSIEILNDTLHAKVFGQDEAIESVCDKILEASYNVVTNAPKAIFFFLGPPATGKTYLSEIMAQNIPGVDGHRVFDMTQYTSSNQGFGLFGLEKGYTDAGEGKLTGFVKKNPNAVIVFDEIEKTHPDVLSNFLSMLSSGKVTDGYTNEEVDFTNTIQIFTSNLGSELYNNHQFLELMKSNPFEANSMIIEAIGRETRLQSGHEVPALKPELLSRLSSGQIVLFNRLTFSALESIATQQLTKVQQNFEKEFGITFEYQDFSEFIAAMILAFAPNIDARKLKARLPLTFFDRITDYIRRHDDAISHVKIVLNDKDRVLMQETRKEIESDVRQRFIQKLFRKNETFSHEIALSFNNGVLTLTIHSIERKKLKRSADFSGESGLVFTVPDISFKHVAGHAVAKQRLGEVINILKDPALLEKFDVNAPKGMLLYGVPGTGKTMLAKAFAHEADLPFIETTGTEILSIEHLKNIFKKAREYAPSIIFIDEIDAIGSRGQGFDIQINQLLTELNGFSDSAEEMVFVIAATNLKDKIDPAILRSGRIDLHIEIDKLDRDARGFFIDKILEKPTKGSFNREEILTYTNNMTGADLAKVGRECSLYVLRHGLDAITEEILIDQINTIKYGERITHHSVEKRMESTAIHEAGHAIISILLMPEQRIEQVTVVPRGDALGFVSFDQESSEMGNLTRQDIKDKLCIAMAGRIAQIKKYGEEGVASGASGDLNHATWWANYAVSQLGMGEKSGYINTASIQSPLFAKSIEEDVKAWLEEAKERTAALVDEHWNKLERLADILVKQEIVLEDELNVLMGK